MPKQEDGPFVAYYENGQLSAKGTYNDGKKDGPFESYQKDEMLLEKGTYNFGEKCGEWIEDGETVTYDPCPPDLEDRN